MGEIKIIFLHGFWRSSSTYFWNKFRFLDKTIAFYEPFHETLDKTLKEIPYQSSTNWKSNHPEVEDYWKEYKIFGEGGVEKTAKEFHKKYLGHLPLSPDLRSSADNGEPLTHSKPDHEISRLFKDIAEKIKQSFH